LRIASAVVALLINPLIIVVILGSAGFIEGDFLPVSEGPLMWAFGGLLLWEGSPT
jgi:hypothetical protein